MGTNGHKKNCCLLFRFAIFSYLFNIILYLTIKDLKISSWFSTLRSLRGRYFCELVIVVFSVVVILILSSFHFLSSSVFATHIWSHPLLTLSMSPLEYLLVCLAIYRRYQFSPDSFEWIFSGGSPLNKFSSDCLSHSPS
jgi:hypothetical protein